MRLVAALSVFIGVSIQAQPSIVGLQFSLGCGSLGITNGVQFGFGTWRSLGRGSGIPTYQLFEGITFTTSDVGSVFTISSDSDDPDFDAMVSALTSGQDYLYMDYCLLGGGGGGTQRAASQLFSGVSLGWPDLRGYEIQSFSLQIDSLSFESPGSDPNHDGNWTDVTGQVTLGIDGVVAVPEPSTTYLASALMAIPLGLSGLRHLRHRKQVL